MKLQYVDIEDLTPYKGNPRINDHAVDKVAQAIKEFGFKVPIIALEDGTIVDGHLRYKSALQLGLKKVPVILANDLSETQIKAFRLSVNRVSDIAEWDTDLLKYELNVLEELNYDVDSLGFDFLLEDEEEEDSESEGGNGVGDYDDIAEVKYKLSNEQLDLVNRALKTAKEFPLQDPEGINDDMSGNALYAICELYLNKVEG